MDKKFTRLTLSERVEIAVMLKQGASTNKIAVTLGRSFVTIRNEIRNGTVTVIKNGYKEVEEYSPEAGQNRADRKYKMAARKKGRKGPRHCQEFLRYIEQKVGVEHYSIEAAVDYAKENELFAPEEMVCVTTIYNYIDAGILKVRNIDLPNKARRRLKATSKSMGKKNGVLPDGALKNDRKA